MPALSRFNRRWAAPALALVTVVGVGAVPQLLGTASASSPDLPTLTPAELLAKARTQQVTALSGTVALTSNLGLPSLGGLGAIGGTGGMSLANLASGTHSAQVWVDGPDHLRVTTSAPMVETNWIRNGADLWSYESSNQRATHTTVSAHPEVADGTERATQTVPDAARQTPVEFAEQLLAHVSPSTEVSVASPRYVADRPVYQLVLTPKSAASTVQDVTISVDAATGLPLEVSIDAKSTGNTALKFGFRSVSFAKPAVSTFTFTPPPGATVVQAKDLTSFMNPQSMESHRRRVVGNRLDASVPDSVDTPSSVSSATSPSTLGQDWDTVVWLPSASVPGQLRTFLAGAPTVTVGSHTARLVTTTLFTVLVRDDGRVAVGAVSPAALQAAVASAG